MVQVARVDALPLATVRNRQQLRAALRDPRRRLPRRLRRPVTAPPREVERQYARELESALRDAVKEALAVLRPIANEDINARMDARSDALEREIDGLKIRFATLYQPKVTRAVKRAGERTNKDHKKKHERTMRTVLQIRPEFSEPWLVERINQWSTDNSRLVVRQTDAFYNKLAERVREGVASGKRVETLAREIETDLEDDGDGWAKRRSKVIARDQVGKLFGELTRARHQELGISRYVWRTSRDERVRESHVEREGLIFSWANPIEDQLGDYGLAPDRIDGHPGQPIQCRCTGEPVLEDLLGDLGLNDVQAERDAKEREERARQDEARKRAEEERARREAEELERRRKEEEARRAALEAERKRLEDEAARQREAAELNSTFELRAAARAEERKREAKAIYDQTINPTAPFGASTEVVIDGLRANVDQLRLDPSSADAQEKVRRLANELLLDYGIVSRDVTKGGGQYEMDPGNGRSSAARIDLSGDSVPAHAGAVHRTDGSIAFSKDAAKGLFEWARSGKLDRETSYSVEALIHESLHGASPGSYGSFFKQGVAIEEVTTEVVARKIFRERIAGDRTDRFGARIDGSYQTLSPFRPYSDIILETAEKIRPLSDGTDAGLARLLEEASLIYKSGNDIESASLTDVEPNIEATAERFARAILEAAGRDASDRNEVLKLKASLDTLRIR